MDNLNENMMIKILNKFLTVLSRICNIMEVFLH